MEPTNMSYPAVTDRQMAELLNFARQLDAILRSGIFADYKKPSIHEIGYALKQGALLAHDIEYMCEEQYQQYIMADEVATRVVATPFDVLNTEIG
jgi:hypothetical protein